MGIRLINKITVTLGEFYQMYLWGAVRTQWRGWCLPLELEGKGEGQECLFKEIENALIFER